MALFGRIGKEVVMVVDRSGIHRAHKLASTLAHSHEQFQLHFLPARCGHHLNLIDVFHRYQGARMARVTRLSAATSMTPRATWPSVLWRVARRGA